MMGASVHAERLTERYPELPEESAARRPVDPALRAFDILISGAGLAVLSPAWLATGAAILVSSGRPVLYRGLRVGRYGRTFTMLKFRTLRPDAESRLGPFYGEQLTERTDAEVTSLGRWLRASQLDEIPQLWNVLRGDMSIVGPRPIRPVAVRRRRARGSSVLAATGRASRPHRVRADAHGPGRGVGREARPRPRVHRRPLRAPLPPRRARDDLARAAPIVRSGVGARDRRGTSL